MGGFRFRFDQPKTKLLVAREKKNSATQGICPTVRHETLGGGGGGIIFAIFPANHKKKFPRIKITAKKFSPTNLLQSKYSLP